MGAISRKIANLCLNKAAISALTVAPGPEQRTTLAQVRDTSAVTPKDLQSRIGSRNPWPDSPDLVQ